MTIGAEKADASGEHRSYHEEHGHECQYATGADGNVESVKQRERSNESLSDFEMKSYKEKVPNRQRDREKIRNEE